jgi:hypothetical protein
MTDPVTRYLCPMPNCDWSHDLAVGDDPMTVEYAIRTHVDDHSPLEYLRALRAALDANQTGARGADVPTPTPRNEVAMLRTELRIANRHAHTADAERAEMEAELLRTRAELAAARARESRTHAASVTDHVALDAVRRLSTATIEASSRVQARQQAQDTLAVIDRVTAGETTPADGAWGTVWLEGRWRWLTSKMTTEQREYAADCVARWSAALAKDDGDLERGEPDGLRWWREA